MALVTLTSCNNSDSTKANSGKQEVYKRYRVNPEDLVKNFTAWYNYTYYNVKLSQNFVGLNVDSNIIAKADFLNILSTGNFIAVKVLSKDDLPYYKLYKLTSNAEDIRSTIKQMALTEIEHNLIEGKELPAYNFNDLNENIYNNTNTRGKIVVLKCWFIHCFNCVQEFPELNKLVNKYKNRDDIKFVSLALDSKKKLESFLKTKEFKYAVVPDQEKYMKDNLKITAYPTHILIDRNGKIVKVVNTIEELAPFLETYASKGVTNKVVSSK